VKTTDALREAHWLQIKDAQFRLNFHGSLQTGVVRAGLACMAMGRVGPDEES
jgi:hypothetical protein